MLLSHRAGLVSNSTPLVGSHTDTVSFIWRLISCIFSKVSGGRFVFGGASGVLSNFCAFWR